MAVFLYLWKSEFSATKLHQMEIDFSKKVVTILCILSFCFQGYGQNRGISGLQQKLDSSKNAVGDAVGGAVNNQADKAIGLVAGLFRKRKKDSNPPAQNNQAPNSGNSENRASIIPQSTAASANPATSSGPFPLTKDIFVPLSGEYPAGYTPAWRIVGSAQQLTVNSDQYITKRGGTVNKTIPFGIVEYQGRSAVNFNTGCDCIADIDLNGNRVTLSQTSRRFQLTNFRRKQQKELDDPNAPCQTMAAQTQGGWKGYIDLASDLDGNLVLSLRLENYAAKNYAHGALMYTYYKDGISLPNMVTPAKAVDMAVLKVKNEREQQDRAAQYTEKQEERKRLDFEYNNAVKTVKGRAAATTGVVATYKGYSLRKPINLNQLADYDISRQDGARQAYEKAADAYYAVLGWIDLNFDPAKFEPYDRDEKFARRYCLVRIVNSFATDIAAFASIGDIDKLNETAARLKGFDNDIEIIRSLDPDGYNKLKGDLKFK